MVLRLITFVLLLTTAYSLSSQNIARVENIKIQSEPIGQEREILVYTPVEYDSRTYEYFNVVYVFDSQGRHFFDLVTSMITFLTDYDQNKAVIVVGITSPYNEELDYSRNNDLLPVLRTKASQDRYGEYSGNVDNFHNYVAKEVVPFINSNYRLKGHSIAVGHSLSASFILYSLTKSPNLFNNYIAVSPNFAYENDMLASQLMNFDYSKLNEHTFLYLSHANEGIEYWPEWKPAREKVYSFLGNLEEENMTIHKGAYPDKNHFNTFPASLENALSFYYSNIYEKQKNKLSTEQYEVHITVQVPTETDEIYIVGNQESLGNWDPGKVKMKRVSALEREITLKLSTRAEFKFTRGGWDSEAELAETFGTITIRPELENKYIFKIASYMDRY